MVTERILLDLGYYLIWLGVPVSALFLKVPGAPVTKPSTFKAALLAVLVGWILLLAYRIGIAVPVEMSISTDPMYDAVGGNVAYLFFGWFIMMVPTVPLALLRVLLVRRMQKRGYAGGSIEA